MTQSREERIAGLSEKWLEEAQTGGFSHAETLTAAAHLMFMIVAEAPSMDVAAKELTDTHLTLMQRAMIRFEVMKRPRVK